MDFKIPLLIIDSDHVYTFQTCRVTHLTLIDARVEMDFNEWIFLETRMGSRTS
jgi:hypothetical protein